MSYAHPDAFDSSSGSFEGTNHLPAAVPTTPAPNNQFNYEIRSESSGSASIDGDYARQQYKNHRNKTYTTDSAHFVQKYGTPKQKKAHKILKDNCAIWINAGLKSGSRGQQAVYDKLCAADELKMMMIEFEAALTNEGYGVVGSMIKSSMQPELIKFYVILKKYKGKLPKKMKNHLISVFGGLKEEYKTIPEWMKSENSWWNLVEQGLSVVAAN